jgi:biotin transport system substrate-specific component
MKNKLNVYQMAVIGVMTAVICILGPLSIPIGLVPISFTTLAIFIALYALGLKKGVLSIVLYIVIGLIGIPVFSNFSSGPAKLFGPTGGYIISYAFMALIAGYFIDRYSDKWYLCVTGMIIGSIVLYSFGTAWLAYQANLTAGAALAAGAFPFIPGDLAKIAIAAIAGPLIRKRLIKAKLFHA